MDHYWCPDSYGYYFFYLNLAHAISQFTISYFLLPYPFYPVGMLDPQPFDPCLFLISFIYSLPLIETWLFSLLATIYWTPITYDHLLAIFISPIYWLFTALEDLDFFISSWLSDSYSERLSIPGWTDAFSLCVPSTESRTLLVWILFYSRYKCLSRRRVMITHNFLGRYLLIYCAGLLVAWCMYTH